MKKLLQAVWRDESGAAMVEYALLVALVALVAIVGVAAVGTNVNAQFMKISCKIASPSASCDQ
jgi:pilus assembly protein Flp/PilA